MRSLSKCLLFLTGALLAAGCATVPSHHPLTIGPDPAQEALVLDAVARVRAVPTPRDDEDSVFLRDGLTRDDRDAVLTALVEEDLSVSFAHDHPGGEVVHQVTAGLVALHLETYVGRMDPARRWGRSLAKYYGGDWALDTTGELGRPKNMRERMVLGTPWFAVCAPDQDVEKRELARFGEGFVEVDWVVTHSANASVEIDEGYVRFEAVTVAGQAQTLIVFESVHRLDPGPIGRMGPAALVEKAIRDVFRAHLARYRGLAIRGK